MKTENFEGKSINPKSEWTFASGRGWRVFVVAWHNGINEWRWNVYLDITSDHPAFSFTRDGVRAFPFHGGVSSDILLTYDHPAPRYDFERVVTIRRVGSDYAHDGDWYGECSQKGAQ